VAGHTRLITEPFVDGKPLVVVAFGLVVARGFSTMLIRRPEEDGNLAITAHRFGMIARFVIDL
jgi:hypothetical protein